MLFISLSILFFWLPFVFASSSDIDQSRWTFMAVRNYSSAGRPKPFIVVSYHIERDLEFGLLKPLDTLLNDNLEVAVFSYTLANIIGAIPDAFAFTVVSSGDAGSLLDSVAETLDDERLIHVYSKIGGRNGRSEMRVLKPFDPEIEDSKPFDFQLENKNFSHLLAFQHSSLKTGLNIGGIKLSRCFSMANSIKLDSVEDQALSFVRYERTDNPKAPIYTTRLLATDKSEIVFFSLIKSILNDNSLSVIFSLSLNYRSETKENFLIFKLVDEPSTEQLEIVRRLIIKVVGYVTGAVPLNCASAPQLLAYGSHRLARSSFKLAYKRDKTNMTTPKGFSTLDDLSKLVENAASSQYFEVMCDVQNCTESVAKSLTVKTALVSKLKLLQEICRAIIFERPENWMNHVLLITLENIKINSKPYLSATLHYVHLTEEESENALKQFTALVSNFMESLTGEKTTSDIHFHPSIEASQSTSSKAPRDNQNSNSKKQSNNDIKKRRQIQNVDKKPQATNSKNSNAKSPSPDDAPKVNASAQSNHNSKQNITRDVISEPAVHDKLSGVTDSELEEMEKLFSEEVEDFRTKLASLKYESPAKRLCLWRATFTADGQMIHDSTFGSYLPPFLEFIFKCTNPEKAAKNNVLKFKNLSKSHVSASETCSIKIEDPTLKVILVMSVLFNMGLLNMVCLISVDLSDPFTTRVVYLKNEKTKCIPGLFDSATIIDTI